MMFSDILAFLKNHHLGPSPSLITVIPFCHSDHLYPAIPLSIALPHSQGRFFRLSWLCAPGYVLTPENLEVRAFKEREHVMFVLWCLCYLFQYDVFLFHPFTYKIHEFIFLSNQILFHSIYAPCFLFPLIDRRIFRWLKIFSLFPFPSSCEKSSNEHMWANICGIGYQVLWELAKE